MEGLLGSARWQWVAADFAPGRPESPYWRKWSVPAVCLDQCISTSAVLRHLDFNSQNSAGSLKVADVEKQRLSWWPLRVATLETMPTATV